MAKLGLFSEEVDKLIEKTKVKTRTPKEPSINDLKWDRRKSQERLKELEAQDETGWSDLDKSIKGKETNMRLVNNHIAYYTKQIQEKREPFNPMLNKWKDFIVNLCKERGQEIDKIWFDTSAPYDCEVAVRMKGHNCWSSCVDFRFQDGKLKAYDSSFGGGTSFVWFNHLDYQNNPNLEQDKVKEVMEQVFSKKCCSEFDDATHDNKEHRKIEIDEQGWILD